MLAYIKGKVLHRGKGSMIVATDTIGYRVAIIDALLAKIREQETVELFLYQYIRENSVELYGFSSIEEMEFFRQLISVSGVGPKTALSILNAAPLEKMKNSIARNDRIIFKGIPGVGTKTAERILIELRESMGDTSHGLPGQGDDSDIVEALVHLGYTPAIARRAVQALGDSINGIEERMKAALKSLAK